LLLGGARVGAAEEEVVVLAQTEVVAKPAAVFVVGPLVAIREVIAPELPVTELRLIEIYYTRQAKQGQPEAEDFRK